MNLLVGAVLVLIVAHADGEVTVIPQSKVIPTGDCIRLLLNHRELYPALQFDCAMLREREKKP
jgi:hypothetical protein